MSSLGSLPSDFDPVTLRRTFSKDLGRKLSKDAIRRLSEDFGRRLSSDLGRRLAKDRTYNEEVVMTSKGPMTVAWKGDRENPALVTFHDLGMNHVSNFQEFFAYPDMADLLPGLCVFHINATGQEDGARKLLDDFQYPTMEEMAEQVNEVVNHFGISEFVGIGVGLGSNVLIRYALRYPSRVDCLILFNALATAAGWFEWASRKKTNKLLHKQGVNQAVLEGLMWHHFGINAEERVPDLVIVFKHYFIGNIQPVNLAKLSEQFIARTPINIKREKNILERGDTYTLKVPVLNIVGAESPFVEEAVTFNKKLNPEKSEYFKVVNSAMVFEEQPEKVCDAIRLFLNGRGFGLKVRKPNLCEY